MLAWSLRTISDKIQDVKTSMSTFQELLGTVKSNRNFNALANPRKPDIRETKNSQGTTAPRDCHPQRNSHASETGNEPSQVMLGRLARMSLM